MELPAFVIYLSAGAYIAIMIAVLGVPQMLSSYFDLRARRLQEERQEERRREERRQDEERRREERRQDAEAAERRHQEMMVALIAALGRGNGQVNDEGRDYGQGELIRTLQQTIEELREENERLRQERQNGGAAREE